MSKIIKESYIETRVSNIHIEKATERRTEKINVNNRTIEIIT